VDGKRRYRLRASSVALSRFEWVLFGIAVLVGLAGIITAVTVSSGFGGMLTGLAALSIAALVANGMTREQAR